MFTKSFFLATFSAFSNAAAVFKTSRLPDRLLSVSLFLSFGLFSIEWEVVFGAKDDMETLVTVAMGPVKISQFYGDDILHLSTSLVIFQN